MCQQEVGGSTTTMTSEAAVGADQLDLEAAEQLIQLSGGGDGASESRSADSIQCRVVDHQAGVEEKGEDEVAVESRRRRKRIAAERFPARKGGEQADRRSAESVSKSSSAAGTAVESRRRRSAAQVRDEKDGAAGVVDGGEERKRPRFRWLADVYGETRQLTTRRAPGGCYHPEAEERRKRKRAADADDEVIVPMVPVASKERAVVA